jgi:predicted AAA+ superfamily ATPase
MKDQFIERIITAQFGDSVRPNKVLLLYGARRVGKTELIKGYLKNIKQQDYLLLNGDDQTTIDLLQEKTVANYTRLLGKQSLLVIDEAQKIPAIGQKLKLMVDEIDGIRIIVTGSSVFDLTNKLGEPLVGRKTTLWLHPLSQMEFSPYQNYLTTTEKLEERMIFGSYPELEHLSDWKDKENYLYGIVNDYLLKDILEFEGIKKAGKLIDLLRLVALQVGNEVNIDELAKNLKGISRNTVEQYLDLLTKVFVLYNIRGYSNNLRKEITKTSKWYFYDNGIRNAVIKNFNPLQFRSDTGALWENYLASERTKYNSYKNTSMNTYFWRTYDQQELDWVEEGNGELHGAEFKWSPKKTPKAPAAWTRAYPAASYQVVNPDNYLDWIV